MTRFRAIRFWLIKKLANGDAVMMNLCLLNGVYIDLSKSRGLMPHNVCVELVKRPALEPNTIYYLGTNGAKNRYQSPPHSA